jgi:DNA gyrase subunit A
VRGIRLADGDEVISMAVLRHVEATAAERSAYLRYAAQQRAARGEGDDADVEPVEAEGEDPVEADAEGEVSFERLNELAAADELILTVTDSGLGKRTSAFDYRVTGRGGQGLTAYNLARLGEGRLAASFPVEEGDEVLLVTDAGQLIRTPVSQVRIAARATGGVFILRTGEGERVVSVERLEGGEAGGDDEAEAPDAA